MGAWRPAIELSIEDADLTKLMWIARSGVASKRELKDRIMAAMDDINQCPVVHPSSYTLEEAA